MVVLEVFQGAAVQVWARPVAVRWELQGQVSVAKALMEQVLTE